MNALQAIARRVGLENSRKENHQRTNKKVVEYVEEILNYGEAVSGSANRNRYQLAHSIFTSVYNWRKHRAERHLHTELPTTTVELLVDKYNTFSAAFAKLEKDIPFIALKAEDKDDCAKETRELASYFSDYFSSCIEIVEHEDFETTEFDLVMKSTSLRSWTWDKVQEEIVHFQMAFSVVWDNLNALIKHLEL